MMAAVELDGVVKTYGRRAAVAGVSLSVAPGERLALLGHNGAGKSTLMKLMLGLIPPSAGRLTVLGERPGDVASPGRRAIGFLPEAVVFHDAMTGAELIGFYARLKARPVGEARELLARVGLAEAAGRRVATYSKGMRQRLGLAQALLGHPRLLLLDEPTSGLDPELRQGFYDIVRERAEAGAAVILSSHVLTELEERTDRIAILDHGRLVALGTLDQLRARARLKVTVRALMPGGVWQILAVAPERKLAALRDVLSRQPLDVTVSEPGLDQLYAHFLAEAGP
jgi:Cu-processing system ATP-binding protein